MAVITRWSYKRGGRKAGFHCTILFEILLSTFGSVQFLKTLPDLFAFTTGVSFTRINEQLHCNFQKVASLKAVLIFAFTDE